MNLLTKSCILLLTGLLFVAPYSLAATKYVTEVPITLRTGPGMDHKVILNARTGQALEVITPGEEYTEVQMPNGKQGWVLTRFLTDKEPATEALARLRKRHERVVKRYEKLQLRTTQLGAEGKKLANELADAQEALLKLQAEHDTLKSDSKEFLNLQTKYDEAITETSSAKEKVDKLDKDLQRLYNRELTTGMLYGGGLIVLGFIVGFIVKRPKRRSPLL